MHSPGLCHRLRLLPYLANASINVWTRRRRIVRSPPSLPSKAVPLKRRTPAGQGTKARSRTKIFHRPFSLSLRLDSFPSSDSSSEPRPRGQSRRYKSCRRCTGRPLETNWRKSILFTRDAQPISWYVSRSVWHAFHSCSIASPPLSYIPCV